MSVVAVKSFGCQNNEYVTSLTKKKYTFLEINFMNFLRNCGILFVHKTMKLCI